MTSMLRYFLSCYLRLKNAKNKMVGKLKLKKKQYIKECWGLGIINKKEKM